MSRGRVPWTVPTFFGAGALGFAVLSLVGWWLLSTPDPGRLGTDTGVTSRKVVRAGLVLTVAGWGMSAALGVVMGGWFGAPPVTGWTGLYLLNAVIAAGWIGVLLQLFGASSYMVHMSKRVKAAPIAKSALDVRYLTIGTLSAAAITAGMAWLLQNPIAAIPGIVAYGCFALTAGRYASVVDLARREIRLAEAVIKAEGRSAE